MRADQSDRQALEAELVRAMEKNLLRVSYLPIIYLPTEELAGFQAVEARRRGGDGGQRQCRQAEGREHGAPGWMTDHASSLPGP